MFYGSMMRTTRSSLTTLGEDFLLGAGIDDEQQWNAAQRLRERQGQLTLGSGCFSVYYPISIPFSHSLTFLLIFMILGRRYQRICHLRWPRTEGLFCFSHLPPKPRQNHRTLCDEKHWPVWNAPLHRGRTLRRRIRMEGECGHWR